MAELTLKDLLTAIAKMQRGLDEVRSEMATKGDLAKIDAKVEAHRAETQAHRAETKKGFADLDKELTRHAAVHRELEKDIETVKRRPARTAARAPRRR